MPCVRHRNSCLTNFLSSLKLNMRMKKFLFVFVICVSMAFFVEAKPKNLHRKKRDLSSNFIFQESKKDIELILSKFGDDEPVKVEVILMVDGNTYHIQMVTPTNHCNAFRARIDRKTKTASFLKTHYDCIKFEDQL